MNSANAWHESNRWPDDPDGSLTPTLEDSVEEAKKRHPSGKDLPPAEPEAEAPKEFRAEDVPNTVGKTDRCDKCGAEALYRLGLNAMELDFCHHHSKKYARTGLNHWNIVGVNRSLLEELYSGGNRAQGSDHA